MSLSLLQEVADNKKVKIKKNFIKSLAFIAFIFMYYVTF